MPETNNDNQGNDNTVFNLSAQPEADVPIGVSADQTTMFAEPATMFAEQTQPVAEDVTRMEIPHNEIAAEQPAVVASEGLDKNGQPEEAVSSGMKMKILATLVIVGIAGYAAYWVQEPVQLRTDVLGGGASAPAAGSTVADTGTVAANASGAADATSTPADATASPSVSVDVSLFGFNPAALSIDKGTTVVWTNTSTADQTVIGTAADGESFSSPVLTSSESFSFKFDTDADFSYYSTYNPALKATIKVGTGTPAPAATDVGATSPMEATSPTDIGGGVSPAVDNTLNSAAQTALSGLNPAATGALSSAAVTTSTTADQLSPAAAEIMPKKLSKTGPAEDIYAVILIGAAWLNRKKLIRVFKK